ncbi:MAG: pectinesterase family protein [Rhizomicrobium sp.]
MAAFGASAGLAGCALVDGRPGFDAVVAKADRTQEFSGSPLYQNLAAAIAAAPANGAQPFRILLTKGQWRERIVIDKAFIHLTGEGRNESIIVFNKGASDKGPDGQPLGTFGTATMMVSAPDFCANRLTIANDFDYPGHAPTADDKTGRSGAQALALAIEGDADRTFLEDIHLPGYQDTLFADTGRSLFRNCQIDGCVDFIFGKGRAVFEHCDILSKRRPGQDFNGFIAAPDTDMHQPYGMVFTGCRLLKEKDVAPHTVALGRPWRHTTAFADGRYGDPDNVGAAAFLHCWMDDHIVAEGWYPMGYNAKGGGRAMMQPEEARFYEFDSSGPGAGLPSARRRQLKADEARAFATPNVLQGWGASD